MKKFKDNRNKKLDLEIDSMISIANKKLLSGDFESFDRISEHILNLNSIKDKEISKETWLAVGGNLLGVLLIVNYERLHVISSKALSYLFKGRG